MIGQQVRSTALVPLGAVGWLALGIGLVVIGITGQTVHPAVGAVLPLAIGIALLCTRELPFVATFTELGIECSQPPGFVPYESLQGLRGVGRPSDLTRPGPVSYPIKVMHEQGVLSIPAQLNVASDEVFFFLYGEFPSEGSRGVDPILEDYLKEQQKTFGAERVFAYRARSHPGLNTSQSGQAVSLAFMLGGVAWLLVGVALHSRESAGWVVWGVLLAIFGFFSFVVYAAGAGSPIRIKNWRQASLVIGPVGLALTQGDIKGEMRWDELREIQFRTSSSSFTMTGNTGMAEIVLKFVGASLGIADIYDQPLRMIYERIKQYWK